MQKSVSMAKKKYFKNVFVKNQFCTNGPLETLYLKYSIYFDPSKKNQQQNNQGGGGGLFDRIHKYGKHVFSNQKLPG